MTAAFLIISITIIACSIGVDIAWTLRQQRIRKPRNLEQKRNETIKVGNKIGVHPEVQDYNQQIALAWIKSMQQSLGHEEQNKLHSAS